MRSLEQVLREGQKALTEAGIPDSEPDAWLLMEYVFQISKGQYFLHCREEADPLKVKEYNAFLEERKKHIPLQHLTHQAFFMGREFYVDGRVLVPRQDTEILAEEAGKYLRPGMRLLDLCTGSGCILFSLLLMEEGACGIGGDLSEDALEVAALNREKLGIAPERAVLRQSDLFREIPETFQMIVSNPPYIPSEEIGKLSPEVRDHDPHMALDGKEDGLWFYRRITREAREHLESGGWLFYEIGWDQGEAVSGILRDGGFSCVSVRKDYAGLDRVVRGCLK